MLRAELSAMWKAAIAGTAALTIAGASLAAAQPAPAPDAQRYRPTAEDSAALADAAEPLYKSLDDGQKHRFTMLLRMGGPRGMGGPGMMGPRGMGGPQGPGRRG